MLYFLLGFTQVCLVSIQSRNYAQARYGLAGICSLLIATIWWWTVHSMSVTQTDLYDAVGYITGNTLGGMVGIWLHKRYASQKDVSKW